MAGRNPEQGGQDEEHLAAWKAQGRFHLNAAANVQSRARRRLALIYLDWRYFAELILV